MPGRAEGPDTPDDPDGPDPSGSARRPGAERARHILGQSASEPRTGSEPADSSGREADLPGRPEAKPGKHERPDDPDTSDVAPVAGAGTAPRHARPDEPDSAAAGAAPPIRYPGPGIDTASEPGETGDERPHGKRMAVVVLILGIVAVPAGLTVIGGVLLGVAAIVLGVGVVLRVRSGRADGATFAWLGIAFGVLGLLVSLYMWNLFTEAGGSDYLHCLIDAGGDADAREVCNDEFADTLESRLTPAPEPGE